MKLLSRGAFFDVLNTFSSKAKRPTQNPRWHVPKFCKLNKNCLVLYLSVSSLSTANFMYRCTTGKIN